MILKDDLVQDIPTANGPMRTYFFGPAVENTQFPGIILYSEIFQMTGPTRRFATFLVGHGYLVAVPEVYHELEPAGTVLAYDQAGSDKGNYDKTTQGCCLFLSLHELTYQCRNFIGFGIKREVSCVEHVHLGVRYVLAVAFRLANIEREIVLAPED
jgi:hypothetical protein